MRFRQLGRRFRTVAFSAARNDLTFRQQLEPQRASHWRCFYQTHVDNVTQSVHGTAAGADERVTRLVVTVVLGPARADRDQPVGAGIRKFYTRPGAGPRG